MEDGRDLLTSLGAKVKMDESQKEYDIWVSGIQESVLDPVHEVLAQDVWNNNNKLYKKHRKFILDNLKSWLEKMGIEEEPENVTIIGSITTYQYSDTSDIDVNVVLDIPENKIDELLDYLPNGQNLPDTKHPVNYYIAKDAGENVKKKDSAYDVLNDKWIKKPKVKDVKYPYSYVLEIAKFFMDGIDERIAEYERDKVELDLYKSYLKDEHIQSGKEDIQEAIDQKELELKADLDAIFVGLKLMKGFRKEAFEEDYEPDFIIDIQMPNRDFSVNNLVYKTLERFGYLEKLNKYKKIRKEYL
jgi:hypothetical protein